MSGTSPASDIDNAWWCPLALPGPPPYRDLPSEYRSEELTESRRGLE